MAEADDKFGMIFLRSLQCVYLWERNTIFFIT